MASFEALYGRFFGSPIGWFKIYEVRPHRTNLLNKSLDRVFVIKDRIQLA